ncbi:MAG: hypothetical protein J6B57_01105 [Oscillospiraceae bacterium]|nr:hypothetical protein [Oscillospiraceae bacterium]
MADVTSVLERARTTEFEVRTQIEHIEQLHRIMKRAVESSDYAAQIVKKLVKLEHEVNDTIDRLCDAKAEALTYISILTGEERNVIESYYILGKSWQRIANDLFMSERRVFLLRKSALDKLHQRFGDDMAM